MKVSEITTDVICNQIRVIPSELDTAETAHLSMLLTSAVAYVKSYTGLSSSEIDENEDITIAVLTLISDMYDDRQMSVGINQGYVNKTAQAILDLHCKNLLPQEDIPN